MTQQAENTDVELEIEDEVIDDVADDDAEESEESDGESDDSEAEITVQIGDEESPTSEDDNSAPAWVKELRQEHRELKKRNRELEQQAAKATPEQVEPALTMPTKPKLEQYDYDEEKYEAAMDIYHARKTEIENTKKKQESAAEARKAEAEKVLVSYHKAAGELKVKDFKQVEDDVVATLSVLQQNVLLHCAENPALIVYAIGKNPAKLKELASIATPEKFAAAIGKLEQKGIKVTDRKTAKPAPEGVVKGSAPLVGGSGAQLDKLREEAMKTGDFTKVHAYKAKLKAAKK